jgi:hypothetical protein
MGRSVGVTVSAVLAMVGSLLALAFGLLMALGLFMAPAQPPPGSDLPPEFFKTILLLAPFVYILPAVWGIVTSVGLFQMKNWARISIIVFAALLTLGGFLGSIGALALAVATPPSNLPGEVMVLTRIFFAVFTALQLGIGIWWLVFFNRPKVRALFQAARGEFAVAVPLQTYYPYPSYSVPPPPPAPGAAVAAQVAPQPLPPRKPGRPMSISIIAWSMLAITVFFPLYLALRMPAVAFTAILTGWPAMLYYLAVAAVHVYVGIGLLRLQAAARAAGIAYFVFAFLNSAVFYFAPGGRARIDRLMEMQRSLFPWMPSPDQGSVPFDMTPFLFAGAIAGLVFILVPLYFLITRQRAFTKQAATSAS